jgi:hypothetical protein
MHERIDRALDRRPADHHGWRGPHRGRASRAVKFTQTRGGTELGFPLDRDATDISGADFDEGTGNVHVEGHLILNDDPVRCIADIDLATLKGTGQLKLEEKSAAATE